MTVSEKEISKMYLKKMDKTHSCNEYKLLMGLLEKEDCKDAVSREELMKEVHEYLEKGDSILVRVNSLQSVRAV